MNAPDSGIRNLPANLKASNTFDEMNHALVAGYDTVSTAELMAEFDERIAIFRELGLHGEALILSEGRRTWNELRDKIGEEKFRYELIATLALAFHSSILLSLSRHRQEGNQKSVSRILEAY